MRVWVTRARPGADRTGERLVRLGHDPLVASLLEVAPSPGRPLRLDGVGALAFTSANGVRALVERLSGEGLAAATPTFGLPVFAVGAATAAAAREAGFRQVVSADGDVAALAALIAASRAAFAGEVLHPCASETAGDLAGPLASHAVGLRTAPLYATQAAATLPDAAARALDARGLDAVLVHSPKAALALRRLLDPQAAGADRAGGHPGSPHTSRPRSSPRHPPPRLAALSPACAAPLARLPFAEVRIAPTPDEAALLAALEP